MRNSWKLMILIICICAAVLSSWGVSCKGKEVLVSSKFLPNLLIDKTDIPLDAALRDDVALYDLDGLTKSDPSHYEEKWNGKHGHISCSVQISVTVAASSKEAKEIAGRESMSVAMAPQSVSGKEPYSSFSDYAWSWGVSKGGGRFLFVRGNVVGDVSVHVRNTDGHDMVLSLAKILSRKIDAVFAGEPEPAPILPVNSYDDVGSNLWGSKSERIVLQMGNSMIPRSMLVKKIAPNDYLVSLLSLVPSMGLEEHLEKNDQQWPAKSDRQRMSLIVNSDTIVFTDGSPYIRANGRSIKLDKPIKFYVGRAIVPISVFEKALGYKITWQNSGKIPMVRIEPR